MPRNICYICFKRLTLLCLVLVGLPSTVAAALVCAGVPDDRANRAGPGIAAKAAAARATGTRQAIVLFAHFSGQESGRGQAPAWATGLFDSTRPGSFSHFYAEMSLGQLQIDGQVIDSQYTAQQPAEAYLADTPTELGRFGVFSQDILGQADEDIDFSAFDNDGPDGLPNSGDDDGSVDALFIVIPSILPNLILGNATGIAQLGMKQDFITDDQGADGLPIRIKSRRGSFLLGRDFPETVGTMAHEYGHILGLPDLFNTAFLGADDPGGPENDSAGIGRWGLMGWGATGWHGDDGPVAFSAWSRLELGWGHALAPAQGSSEIRLEPVAIQGQLYKIPIGFREYFLLENRRKSASYYDRNMPAEGLLIWHIEDRGELRVDLECADGRWQDAGFPVGRQADPVDGGDNLDFWAHDRAYADGHAGNQGDETDPFDGVRFRTFTTATNPSSGSFEEGFNAEVSIEDIRIADDQVIARFSTALGPARVRLEDFSIDHSFVDGLVVVGSPVGLHFRLVNYSVFPLRDLRTRIVTDDPWIEVVRDGPLGTLGAGAALNTNLLPRVQQPSLRFSPELKQRHRAEVTLEILVGDQVLHSESLTLEVLPFVRLFGQVTDAEGSPASGVEVRARGQTAPLVVHRALTDQQGAYALELPGGNYAVSASLEITERLRLNQDTELSFVLPGSFQIRGEILTGTPEPALGEMVFYPLEDGPPLVKVEFTAFSQVLGTGYAIALPPGRFHVAMDINDSVEGIKDFGAIDVRASQQVDFKVPVGVFTEGKLVDSQGFPVARRSGLRIQAVSSRHANTVFLARDDGRFFLKAVPGEYDFSARVEGQYWALGTRRLEGDSRPFELRLPAADAELTGHVYDAGGAPAAQARVMLVGQPIELASDLFHTSVQTDSTGAYQIRQASGVYTLIGGHFIDQRQLIWRGAVHAQFDVRDLIRQDLIVPDFEQTHQVTGNVQYEAGRPHTSVLLVFYDEARGLVTQVTIPAEEGSYSFPLNRGDYRVWGRLNSVVMGIETVYDLGELTLTDDVTWDAHLRSSPTAIEEQGPRQQLRTGLGQNFPNPLNSATTIPFKATREGFVRLEIYNLAGQRVARLVDAFHAAGSYVTTWDGTDDEGRASATAVYVYRLQTPSQTETRKLLLLR